MGLQMIKQIVETEKYQTKHHTYYKGRDGEQKMITVAILKDGRFSGEVRDVYTGLIDSSTLTAKQRDYVDWINTELKGTNIDSTKWIEDDKDGYIDPRSNLTPREMESTEVKDEFKQLNESNGAIAREIQRQIGNKAFTMMGASNYAWGEDDSGNEYLTFKIGRNSKGINWIRITLYAMDTYDIVFSRVRDGKITIVKEVNGIYFDQLHEIIEKTTGLYLSL